MYRIDIEESLLSKRGIGVLLIGEELSVLHSSPVAHSQLAEAGWSITAGQLEQRDECKTSLLRNAFSSCFSEQRHKEQSLILGDFPDSLIISYSYSRKTEGDPTAILATTRSLSGGCWEEAEHRLASTFGLTNRESQLGVHLGRGLGLDDFASQYFLTVNTVKTHLKQLFKKLGVNKQIQVAVMVNAAIR